MKDINGKDRPCESCRFYSIRGDVTIYGYCQWLNQSRSPFETCSMWEGSRQVEK